MGTQEEIAALANLSRATVNTILRRLATRRWVELRYRSIVVAGTTGLRRIATDE